MKAHPYSFLTLLLITLAFLFSGQATAADIDATLSDMDDTSSFQVKNSESTNNVLMKVQSGGNVGIGTTGPTEKLDVNSDAIRIRSSQTPASIEATCDAGTIAWDANYIYICVEANSWKRAAISTWE